MDKEYLKNFSQYVKKYDLRDPKIMGKFHHSYRVMENVIGIAKDLNCSDRDIYLLTIIGLYHDIARFKQWTEYHTFEDKGSFDHGLVGKEIFLEEKFVSCLTEEEKKQIGTAIYYHNKLDVPPLSSKDQLFTSIIREADELDIIREQGTQVHDKKITLNRELLHSIYHHELGNVLHLKTDADYILLMLSWISQFQFSYSFQYLKEYQILEHKFELLEIYGETEEIQKLKDFIYKEVDKNVREKI